MYNKMKEECSIRKKMKAVERVHAYIKRRGRFEPESNQFIFASKNKTT